MLYSYFVIFIFGNFCNNYWINNDCGYELDYSRCNMCRNVVYLYFEVSKLVIYNFIYNVINDIEFCYELNYRIRIIMSDIFYYF